MLRSLLVFVLSASSEALKVTVVGGTGFVGTRVCKILAEKGAEVTSVSKSGTAPSEPWASSVTWKAVDLLGDSAALDAAMGSPDAIVSCMGIIGTDEAALRAGNGAANENAFASAKRAGASRSVLVSVASEVAACRDTFPGFFAGYFDGKEAAEKACAECVQDATRTTIVKPSFIYGGDEFGLLPPRVSAAYGSGVEELLSFGLIETIADAAPGLIKVALWPPVSVDAVAGACASAALGELAEGAATRRAVGELDGTAAIKAAAGDPPATGLTDAIAWATEGVMKAADAAVAKVEEMTKEK